MLNQRLNPAPGLFLLVAAHKQVQASADHVQQQALICADPLGAETLVKVQIELHRHQRCGRAALPIGLSLRQQMQLQAVFGLQVDDQLVGTAGRGVENGMRCGTEVHHDAGITSGQALAGTDVKRHPGPAPVGNLGAQGNKGFGLAMGTHPGLFTIARNCDATRRSLAVLAAHHVAGQAVRGPGLERTQHLELFVPDRVRMGINGRLHANGTQQLQRMVLHHVAQRAGGFVETATAFYTQVFGDGDLDVSDVLAPPQRLKQGIAKAQRKQVLHRRFAQVMVNPEDLVFRKVAAHGLVDGTVAGQVVAQRFF